RSCILGPYVPLRTSTKRERVANELCCISLLTYDIVQIDEPQFENGLLDTLTINLTLHYISELGGTV
ncbi:MAG TPA: hypothetical protein VHP81_02220, partial [Lachnospiraceae bacterium]|nr:hypothetical protein [Lachnospiraceae bacterium]